MLLISNPALSRQILQLLEAEYKQDKPLPHLTELIYCLARSYYDRVDPLPATEREILLFAIGCGLERLLLKHQRKVDAGVVDGIHFTPDFLAFTDLPGELKTGRFGRKRIEEGVPDTWKRQILGYMKCLGVNQFELAYLYIISPELMPFRVKASQEEIDENWQWMLERKVIYLNCMEQNIVPIPRLFAESWECDYCRYSVRCEAQGGEKR